ncbi:ThuA domain-containing protein [Sphingobium sp. AR-3-1]|uniref:ThuA domain-containing protein n=1 Tax=Sphingobium psychrophilum TaxID=2728834 RepID=A0A7X9WYH7_9SPHN|nr:ThuA domain-containing protein [Sphingobium psychrophilum]NML12258.1 ThuA domain-containing protein [Sphingobium psychrophilum]
MTDDHPKWIDCVPIAGGLYHDIDFARLELLKLLGEDEHIRTRVFENYDNIDAIVQADFLITYTCDVIPSLEAQEALRDWVKGGGRWYALHGTNSVLRLFDNGLYGSPRWAPLFMETLGSQFIAHPPIVPYSVTIADPDHVITPGIGAFETTDELYLMECHGDLHVLLETEFAGEATGFDEADWALDKHPVLYIKRQNKGAVLYNTLGHCQGHYDMQPHLDYWPTVDRCAWDLPVFYDLLRRGIDWAKESRA